MKEIKKSKKKKKNNKEKKKPVNIVSNILFNIYLNSIIILYR